jgi:putative SOS response-associated peptidase YedK
MISTILEQARAEEAAANVPQAIDLLDRLGPNVLISGTRVAKQSRRLGGLVNSWTKDASRASMCINAKAETVDKLPSFREAFEKRRCVVPADGFFEWRGPKVRREPLWIHPADGALLLFAGLFEAWQPQPGEWRTTFTIITTAANRTMEPIHNRMPVILDEAGADYWMNSREPDSLSLKRLLAPAPDDLLKVRPASLLVNSVKNEGPELLEDLSLFGR